MKATTTLVLGATGATGKHLVRQLLEQNQSVRAIVRSKEKLVESLPNITHDNLVIFEGTALDMTDDEIQECVIGCDAIVSCLGHNMTMKGMFGKPHRLVRDSVQRVYEILQNLQPQSSPTKLVLMGTNGAANPDGSDDIRPMNERIILSLLRFLLPPVKDNEEAAEYFSNTIGQQSNTVEWVVVRPDDLIDGDVSEYKVFDKPYGSLFGGGETTRANVAAFMSKLILDDEVWVKWKYRMPMPQNTPK